MHYGRYKRHRSTGPAEVIKKLEFHGMTLTPEYNSWKSMIARCENMNHEAYPRYGGRGIIICQEWRDSFSAFYRDLGPRPKGLTLERRNVNGNYEPANCYWATRSVQGVNQRRKPNKTGYVGVRECRGGYMGTVAGVHTGWFKDINEAVWMRDQFALGIFGDVAQLNFEYEKTAS